jgi:hypothetical protein
MDELIGRVLADEGIDRNAAEPAVGIIVGAIPGLSQFV